ncbi:MAG: hypothetical protein WC879_13070 [Melioribacteraceae bacterium]
MLLILKNILIGLNNFKGPSIRPQKNRVKKFDERNDQRKMLFDDPAFKIITYNKSAGEEFIFRNEANQILADFFEVLNFCFFSFKRKEGLMFFQ